MLTASGDQTISLWDTGHADQVASFRGHSGSVKTVCPMPAAHAVFASGACQDSQLWSSCICAAQAFCACTCCAGSSSAIPYMPVHFPNWPFSLVLLSAAWLRGCRGPRWCPDGVGLAHPCTRRSHHQRAFPLPSDHRARCPRPQRQAKAAAHTAAGPHTPLRHIPVLPAGQRHAACHRRCAADATVRQCLGKPQRNPDCCRHLGVTLQLSALPCC